MQISYAQESHNFKTTKALDIFNALCEELDLSYVDTLDLILIQSTIKLLAPMN